jgi:ribonuclease R
MNKRKEKIKKNQPIEKKNTMTGELHIARNGAGFLINPDNDEAIWIEERDLGTSLPGDTVTIRISPPSRYSTKSGLSGRILRIDERHERSIVGTVASIGRFTRVKPLNPAYRQDFVVPSANGAKVNDRVMMRLVRWTNPRIAPEGEITGIIGPADDPSLDTLSVMKQYDLPESFPQAVIDEAERTVVTPEDLKGRLDLRKTYIFTCDPESARDYDDALSISKDKQGRVVLGVHIADVSHYVKSGSALDREAYKRSTSVYLVDKVIPMLPEQLSNGLCSLVPNEDRLAFSVFMTYDKKGNCVERKFAKSVIKSKDRFTYEQVMAIIAKGTGRDRKERTILAVNELAQLLKRNRFANGALDMDVPEATIKLDESGRMTGIEIRPYDESHQMIEECMVAANEAVATELWTKGIKIPARLHEPPAPEKLEELRMSFEDLGIKCGDLSQPKILGAFLKKIKKSPLVGMLSVMVLKSMKRALYSPEAIGHFGLAKKFYAHFTSPIRRYPDLVLHRQLAGYLTQGKKGAVLDIKWLLAQTAHSSECEQTADEAERMLCEIKKYRYLQQILSERNESANRFKAVVGKCTGYGLFVDIQELAIGGMVHISTLSDKFVRFDPVMETLSDSRTTWEVGTIIDVRVSKVDFDGRKLDFEPIVLKRSKERDARKFRKGRRR